MLQCTPTPRPHTENVTAGGPRCPVHGCQSLIPIPTMSTTPTTTPPTVECRAPDCTTLDKKWTFHHGKFCSTECETKHAGREAISQFKFDHTRCFTCFRQLKEIEPPKPDFEFTERGHGWTLDDEGEPTLEFYSQEQTRDAACGFQYPTEHAGTGEKTRPHQIVTGTICGYCGNTDHTDHYATLADRAAIGRLASLLAAEDDLVIDVHELHRVYEATQDVDLAAGIARCD